MFQTFHLIQPEFRSFVEINQTGVNHLSDFINNDNQNRTYNSLKPFKREFYFNKDEFGIKTLSLTKLSLTFANK